MTVQADSRADSPGTTYDARFCSFVERRLVEEHAAASRRLLDAPDEDHALRALRMVGDLLALLRRGGTPDRMSCDLLVSAYAAHPDFDPAWNRWRH